MAVKETPTGEDEFSIYDVSEHIEVYDAVSADAINHLLNHIKFLVFVADVPANVERALSKHPRYVGTELAKINHKELIEVIKTECKVLVDKVCAAAEGKAADKISVPFLDFDYGQIDIGD